MTWKAAVVLAGLVLGAGAVSAQRMVQPPVLDRQELRQVISAWEHRATEAGVLCVFGTVITAVNDGLQQQYLRVDSLVRADSVTVCPRKTIGVYGLAEPEIMQHPQFVPALWQVLDLFPNFLFVGIVVGVDYRVTTDEEILRGPLVYLLPRP